MTGGVGTPRQGSATFLHRIGHFIAPIRRTRRFLRQTGLARLLAPCIAAVSRRLHHVPFRFRNLLVEIVGGDYIVDPVKTVRFHLPTPRSMCLELDLRDSCDRGIYYYGLQESGTVAFLCRRLSADPSVRIIYDIGAHIGTYAVLAGMLVENHGHVESFEPVPWTFGRLQVNCRINRLSNVRTHALAIGESNGTLTMYVPQCDHSISSAHEDWTRNGGRRHTESPVESIAVPVRSLDSLIENEGVQVPHLIRMDTEGWELAVLRGAVRLLRKHAPDLMVEILSEQETGLKAFFEELGYKAYWIDPEGHLQRKAITALAEGRDWYLTRKKIP